MSRSLRSACLYFIAKHLRFLVPFLARFQFAWAVRRWCVAETDFTSWIRKFGSGHAYVPDCPACTTLFLMDVRGASPESAAPAIAALDNNRVLLLTEKPSGWTHDATTGQGLQERLADVETVICLTPDCLVSPGLPGEFTRAFVEHPDASLAYCDEFYRDGRGNVTDIFCKPAWDPLLFTENSYCGHLFAIRAGFLRAYLTHTTEPLPCGAELMEACLPHCRGTVLHIPKPLFAPGRDTAPIHKNAKGRQPHSGQELPMASIILPFRDRGDLLRPCVESLIAKTDYPHWHCLLLDNGTICKETLRYLRTLDPERFTLLRADMPFNFSALVNKGAESAQGEVLVLLNSDTEVITPGWLRELATMAVKPGIGCVGATLLYPNGLVQHAGIVMGLGGLMHKTPMMGHAHAGWPGDDAGYHGMLAHPRTVSTVTAAALAVRRSVFDTIGGFDEGLPQSFNDVDFCLQAAKLGLRNIITPHARLFHHESASRGWSTRRERPELLYRAYAYMRERWGSLLDEDLWYSPNLASGFSHVLAHAPRRRQVRELPLDSGNGPLPPRHPQNHSFPA